MFSLLTFNHEFFFPNVFQKMQGITIIFNVVLPCMASINNASIPNVNSMFLQKIDMKFKVGRS